MKNKNKTIVDELKIWLQESIICFNCTDGYLESEEIYLKSKVDTMKTVLGKINKLEKECERNELL